ncbi:uncharacterized protein TNCV_1192911 [Trichonephila clavipes]|nr:uncharacterized protein TNCV_1192911 [Trichonephila clavipes]
MFGAIVDLDLGYDRANQLAKEATCQDKDLPMSVPLPHHVSEKAGKVSKMTNALDVRRLPTPLQTSKKFLRCRNVTLLTAEGVFSFVIGELKEQNSEFAKNMKYSLIQRTNEIRNVNLIGLMQYLNFGRKYEAAAVTVDISRLLGKNCLVRQAQMCVLGIRLFCEEEESISNSSHSKEESMEILKERPLTLDEKLEKTTNSKTQVLYCSTKKSTSFNKIMKQKMQLFDSIENPSPNIIK